MSGDLRAGFERVVTQRLDLRAVSLDDLSGLYAITSDPGTSQHAPSERHTAIDTTHAWIERAAARWRTDGLSYWIARRIEDGAVIGVGGVQRHAAGSWNLYYRFTPPAWGHGYATELSRAAIEAGHAIDPEAPVVAWILGHNHASRRVAERLGFTNYGERVDANDGIVRLMYADRPPRDAYDGG